MRLTAAGDKLRRALKRARHFESRGVCTGCGARLLQGGGEKRANAVPPPD